VDKIIGLINKLISGQKEKKSHSQRIHTPKVINHNKKEKKPQAGERGSNR